jgi:type IV pilus assembly protein PilO
MPRSFELGRLRFQPVQIKDPRVAVRAVLGFLLAANLVAAVVAFKPFGGSAEDLRRQQAQLGLRLAQMQTRLAQTKVLVAKAEQARTAGDQFLSQYTTDRRAASSTIYSELDHAAKEAGMKWKPLSITMEPVEGSETLQQMTITAAFDGSYNELLKFVNLLDKSPRFLIISSMTATPQQSGNTLSVSFRVDTFVREMAGSAS